MSQNAIAAVAVLLVSGFAGCAATARADDPPARVEIAPFPSWRESDASYKFFPGDEVEIAFPNAPELNTVAKIGPDGRIALPLVAPVMAANRTDAQLREDLAIAYEAQLVEPRVEVRPKSFASRQVFIGGEVDKPGLYEIGAGADAMQAIVQAGGFKPSARRDQVLILRRGGEGSTVYGANLSPAAFRSGLPQIGPLERYDVVYVPRSKIAQVGLFMQQYVREALPVQFGLYYNLADGTN